MSFEVQETKIIYGVDYRSVHGDVTNEGAGISGLSVHPYSFPHHCMTCRLSVGPGSLVLKPLVCDCVLKLLVCNACQSP
jgi:hypothetical protein